MLNGVVQDKVCVVASRDHQYMAQYYRAISAGRKLHQNGAQRLRRRFCQRLSKPFGYCRPASPINHVYINVHRQQVTRAVEYQTVVIDGVVWARVISSNQAVVGVSPRTASNALMQAGARIPVSLHGRGSMT